MGIEKYVYYLLMSTDSGDFIEVAVSPFEIGPLVDTKKNLMRENARAGIEKEYQIIRKDFY